MASAKANTSRPQPLAAVIGVRKNPKVERGPKADQLSRQPQTTMTIGVRQLAPRTGIAGDYAVAAAGRATGFSTIGRLMTAEAMPKNADSHQIRS